MQRQSNFINFFSILFISSLLSSCSTKIVKSSSSEQRPQVKIIIEHVSKDKWRVSYKLPSSVRGVVFHRQTNQFRSKEWKIVTPGLVFEKIETHESIYSPSGKKFNEFAVEFPPYYKHTPKDYEFFQPYSDGGILFYTGHLYLHPLQTTNSSLDNKHGLTFDEKKRWIPNLEIHSFTSENIIVQGKVKSGEAKWVDDSIKGTYVYFGTINPVTTDSMVAVLDSGTPAWITDVLRDFLPKLFSLYGDKTKQKLSFRPVVYLNYKPTKMSGTSNSGGTLPGLVQLTLEGTNWAKKDQDTLEHIIWFLAHEAAHFWNGQMFDNIDDDAAWLHEGGADAFAYRALFELGIIDKKTLRQRFSNALNLCALGLGQKALNDSSKNRRFENYYHCGSTIMLLVEEALSKQSKDLFDFWEKLLKNSKSNESEYGREDFHKLLKGEFGKNELSQLIEKLELEEREDLGTFFLSLLRTAGMSIKSDNKNASGEFLFRMQMKMLSNIMRADCNGLVDISGRGKGFLVGGKKECKTFKSNLYDIIGVNGVPFRKTGYKTIHLTKESCEKKGHVRLNLYKSKESLEVPCKTYDVEVLNWLEINW